MTAAVVPIRTAAAQAPARPVLLPGESLLDVHDRVKVECERMWGSGNPAAMAHAGDVLLLMERFALVAFVLRPPPPYRDVPTAELRRRRAKPKRGDDLEAIRRELSGRAELALHGLGPAFDEDV